MSESATAVSQSAADQQKQVPYFSGSLRYTILIDLLTVLSLKVDQASTERHQPTLYHQIFW